MGGRGSSTHGSHGAPPALHRPQAVGPPTGHHFPPLTQNQQDTLLAAQRPKQDQAALYAIYEYTSPGAQRNGYSLSQNTNHALENGQPLSPRQQAMVSGLNKLMGPIGVETTLYRADHDDFLRRMGVDYQHLTIAQLKQQLIGRTWQPKGFTSTSHDKSKNPFWPGNYQSGGREVIMRIHTGRSTKIALVQRSQAEVVLGVGTNFRITGVRDTGTWAHPRVGGRKKVIEIDVDTW